MGNAKKMSNMLMTLCVAIGFVGLLSAAEGAAKTADMSKSNGMTSARTHRFVVSPSRPSTFNLSGVNS